MNTKDKGTLGEALAIAHYVSLGYEVAIPLGDRRPYDLIVDTGRQLLKVQVKYTTTREVDLRVSGGNKSRNTHVPYKDGDFDLLLVVSGGTCYEYEAGDIVDRRSLKVPLERRTGEQKRL